MATNGHLNKYFSEVAKVFRSQTDLVENTVMEKVYDILTYISGIDGRFASEPITVGSAFQKLKVCLPDEFDLDVPLVGINKSDVRISKKPLYFGFNKNIDQMKSTFREDLTIVQRYADPLQPPGFEYFALEIRNQRVKEEYSDMMYKGFLVPYLVKKRFKKLIHTAIDRLNLRGVVNLDRQIHGPAITLMISQWDYEKGCNIDVKIDITIIIPNIADFDYTITDWEDRASEFGWPEPCKVDEILDLGINAVSKKNFHWAYSFAQCEKALVDKIDADGGIRKKVHRIEKSLWREVTGGGEDNKLSTYALKNAWLWECERLSHRPWDSAYLSDRYYGCVKKLKEYLRSRNLPMYFCPSVNLLKCASDADIEEMLSTVDEMKDSLKEFKKTCP